MNKLLKYTFMLLCCFLLMGCLPLDKETDKKSIVCTNYKEGCSLCQPENTRGKFFARRTLRRAGKTAIVLNGKKESKFRRFSS